MARFDVYAYESKSVPLVVDIQADLLSDLASCVVIPLIPETKAKKEALPRLKPVIDIEGKTYVLMTTDIGTLPRHTLGKHICNIESTHRDIITEAVDFLFQGF